MKILFAFENPLPSAEADAEVFTTTARYMAPLLTKAWLHVPVAGPESRKAAEALSGVEVVGSWAPLRPAALRHILCGLTIIFRSVFREADLVYTRNLWVACMAVLFGHKVVFDHYRPWPDQIPPLQPLLYRLFSSRHMLVNICHSEYTRQKYLALGVPPEKLCCIHNGYEPARLQATIAKALAKQALGLTPETKTVVYTGRINHKKGLGVVVDAARLLQDVQFLLVGSYGEGPIEAMARDVPNVRIVPWQPPEKLGDFIFAADVLLIPPSLQPLTQYGSTVLPLKLFFYLASGRPILAGNTPDVREVLRDDDNALLVPPDDVSALASGLRRLCDNPQLGARLVARAQADSQSLTWDARAHRIAQLLDHQMHSAPVPRPARSIGWVRNWAGHSLRWLVHLFRKGSWILPPDVIAAAVQQATAVRQGAMNPGVHAYDTKPHG